MSMSLDQLIRQGTDHMHELTKLVFSTVVGVEPQEGGWHLQLEFIEKESIPHGMDVLGLYDVWLDTDGNLQRFARRNIRRRSDMSAEI